VHIQSVEKKKVEIKTVIHKYSSRQYRLEHEYIIEMENFLQSLKQQSLPV
jgi:hypothetical protein